MRSRLRTKKSIFIYSVVSALLMGIILYLFFLQKKTEKIATTDFKDFVAVVNDHGIKKEIFDKKLEETTYFFTHKNQDISSMSSLSSDVLAKLIDEILISQYAEEEGISITEREITNRYQQIVEGYNTREKSKDDTDDAAFLIQIKKMYGMNKSDYLEMVKKDILREKVQEKVKKPITDWLVDQRKNSNIKILNVLDINK